MRLRCAHEGIGIPTFPDQEIRTVTISVALDQRSGTPRGPLVEYLCSSARERERRGETLPETGSKSKWFRKVRE